MPSAETSDGVRTGVDESGLARIEICRPGRMNALSKDKGLADRHSPSN